MSVAAARPFAANEIALSIPEREYQRLLQWPRGRPLSDALRECARDARQWYAIHGRPFVATRRIEVRAIAADAVLLESGTLLRGETFAARLRAGEAHALVAVVASAGPEVADEAARLWAAGRPDAGYFLDRLGAAVAERLLVRVASGLCRDLVPQRERLLPRHSPGCGDWDLADQLRVIDLLGECGPVTMLASGVLKPQHSVLAAFGITRHARVAAIDAASCCSCELDPCSFRRVSFKRPAQQS